MAYHYLDSSVVLSWLLEGKELLSPLNDETHVASSRLLWTEVSRAIHRGLQIQRISAADATDIRRSFSTIAAGIAQVRLTEAVLRRAEGPFPLVTKTLDALHLASAEIWYAEEQGAGADPSALKIWSLDQRMNQCASQLGFATPLLDMTEGN